MKINCLADDTVFYVTNYRQIVFFSENLYHINTSGFCGGLFCLKSKKKIANSCLIVKYVFYQMQKGTKNKRITQKAKKK